MAYARRFKSRRTRFGRRTAKRLRYRRRFTRFTRISKYKPSRQFNYAFSNSQIVKMRYCQQVQLNPASTAGSTASIIYSANSIFSPNVTNSVNVAAPSPHKPMGFSTWSSIYNHYLVLGSRMTVQMIPNNNVNPLVSGGIATIMVQDTSTSLAVGTTVFESGRANFKYIPPSGIDRAIVLRKSVNVRKFFNVRDLRDSIDNYGALMTASPDEQVYYDLQFFPVDTTVAGVAGPLCLITIDYIVLMTGPKDLSQSA